MNWVKPKYSERETTAIVATMKSSSGNELRPALSFGVALLLYLANYACLNIHLTLNGVVRLSILVFKRFLFPPSYAFDPPVGCDRQYGRQNAWISLLSSVNHREIFSPYSLSISSCSIAINKYQWLHMSAFIQATIRPCIILDERKTIQ